MDDIEITVSNDELRTTREAMRELNAIIEQLETGSVEKIVLTRQGKIVGVLMAPYRYAELTND
jgi:hypothetical protein